MNLVPAPSREFDLHGGGALLISGALLVLLHWVLPVVAPFALAAYGGYQLYRRQVSEGLVALAIAVALWFLRDLFGWLLWLVAAVMVGLGVFYFIRGLRAES
jgi:hypothetical protein